MIHGPRSHARLLLIVALAGPLAATSCIAPTTTLPPSSPTAVASAPIVPSAAPASDAGPTPTPTPTPTPSPTLEACQIAPQTGLLPSDRVTDVVVSTSATADLVTFRFGNPSLPVPPQGSSKGSLEAAIAPYTHAASGLPIDVTGEHVAIIRFTGMSIVNDVGEPTYDGPMDFRPQFLPALRTVVNYDMSEGVVAWYLGYDGNGCVTLTSDATSVTAVIDHPAP